MQVDSDCPLRPGWVIWQMANGALVLTVVAKATYQLQPVECPLAPTQDEPAEVDQHWDDDAWKSVRVPDDLVPFKARADVLVVGRAFAPGGKPVRSLTVRVVVGEVDKSVEVFCDRAFALDGTLREGPRFTSMPIAWEHAAGGPETMNPVGARLDGQRDALGMLRVPNLQPPGLHITGADDFVPPAGLGPIAPFWPSRLARLPGRLQAWDHRRWNLAPLPADLSPGFFDAALDDPQVDTLRPDERIVLENLHPAHPRLVTSLSRVTPRASVERRGGAIAAFGMYADTLLIDTERGICTLTWRAQIPIMDPGDAQRVVVSTDPPRPPSRRARQTTVTKLDATRSPSPVLPFVSGPAAPFPVRPPPAPNVSLSLDETIDAPSGEPRPALPFGGGRSPLAANVLGLAPAPALMPLAAASVLPPMTIGQAAVARAPTSPARSEQLPRSEPPPPPQPASPTAAEAPPAVASADPNGLPLEAYPLDRCAAIAASLARRPDETDAILGRHGLDAGLWQRLHRHHVDLVRADEGHGNTGPRDAYDDAYVAQVEEERGAIQPGEHARLLVAVERGQGDQVLALLDVPKGALMRLQRVWMRRMKSDPALGRAVRQAMDEHRKA